MPFEPNTVRPLLQGAQPVGDEDDAPNFFTEVVPAAFRLENMFFSLGSRADGSPPVGPGRRLDPTYNPFSNPENLSGYETYANEFIGANSDEEVDAIKANIDRELADREVVAAGGAGGFVAALAASALDPTIFIPVGGTLKKGESILQLSWRTAVAGGLATSVQEGALQATQETRTGAESALNIAGATFLSGVLGGGFGALSKADQARLGKAVETDMSHPGDGIDPLDPYQSFKPASLSAARNDATELADSLDDNTIFLTDWLSTTAGKYADDGSVAARSANVLEHFQNKFAGIVDPTFRIMTSPSNVVRSLGENLADIPVMLKKNKARVEDVELPDGTIEKRVVMGKPTAQSVESAVLRKTERITGEALQGVDDIYLRYLNGREARLGDRFNAGLKALTRQLPEDKLSPRDFKREVWKALARKDAHDVPEVAEAASHIRQKFIKPLEDEGVELGMFGLERQPSPYAGEPDIFVAKRPDVAETAESYRPRLYNVRKIQRNRDEFIRRLHNHYIRKREEALDRIDQLETRLEGEFGVGTSILRGIAKKAVSDRKSVLKEARQKITDARAAARKAEGVKREAETQLNQAQKRAEETSDNFISDEDFAYYRGLARDIERGRGDEKPTTIIDFIRAQGGFNRAVRGYEGPDMLGGTSGVRETVLDYLSDDDVATLGRRRLTKQNGKSPDYMREAAEEAGWLPEGSTVDDLMDLVQRDLRGERVVHEDDLHIVDYDDYLENLRIEAEKADIDYSDPIALANWMTGESFRKLTSFKKGRMAEAALRERRALERFKGAEENAIDAADALHEANVMARTLRDLAPEFTERAKMYKKALQAKMRERRSVERELGRQRARADVSDADLFQNARRTTQRIESTPAGSLSYDFAEATSGQPKGGKKNTANLSGRFKSRRLDIPDSEIEDFLEDDLEMMLRSTARSMIPDIELTRRFGSVDMEEQMKGIADEFEELIAATPDGKKKEALVGARNKAMQDVLGIRDRLRGTYGLPEDPTSLGFRATQTLKSLNHLRLMGGVTIASIPDAARVVFSNGFGNFLGVTQTYFTEGLKGLKMSNAEIRLAGPGWELVNDTRSMALADILDDYGRMSKFERGLAATRGQFGMLSLMAPWNNAMKHVAGLTTQNRILEASTKLIDGKISKKDAEFLSRLGIGEDDAKAIGALFRDAGQDGNVKFANTEAWGDQRLADVFHDAMRKEIDRVIVTPGQEKPFISSTPLGSLLLQFSSYNFAASQRVSLAMAQGMASADASALMTLTSQISLGMAVAVLKMHQAGRGEEVKEWDERRFLAEGIDRSGVLGVMTYYNMLSERATGGKVGLSALAGRGLLSRYHTRNAMGAFFGPSFGLGQDAFSVSSSLFRGEGMSEGDAAALRRMLPYQNLFYTKFLFDEAERLTQDIMPEADK